MFSLFRTLSVRQLRRRWGLNALVVVSIALGVVVWVASATLYESLERSVLASANPMAGSVDLLVSGGDVGVPRDAVARLAALPGVKEARPLVLRSARVLLDGRREPAVLVGVELPKDGGGDRVGDFTVSPGTAQNYMAARLLQRTPVVVGKGLDALLPPGTKQFEVVILGTTHTLTRVGSVDAGGAAAVLGGNILLVPECELAAKLAGRPGRVSRIDLVVHPDAEVEDVARAARATLGDAAEVRTPRAEDDRFREALAPIKTGALIVSAGALVVGMFLVYNTLSVSVAERRHDIGVLRSVGATRDQIRRLFQGEALVLGLTGSLLGIPLGLGAAAALVGPIGRLVVASLGTATLRFPPLIALQGGLITALVAGLATSLVASLVPALRAAREEPADAVRRVPSAASLWGRALQVGAALLLLALGYLLVTFKEVLPFRRLAVFGSSGCVFLAAFLVIAVAAALAGRLLRPVAQRLFAVEGRLAADNLVRAPGRTGLVVAALAAGVALMAHTAGIIKSNEVAVLGWLDRAVTADLVITSGGPVSNTGQTRAMSADVAEAIRGQMPGSTVVAITWRGLDWPARADDLPVLIAAVDAAAYHDANRARGAAVPHLDLFRRLAEEPNSAVVSENFAALYGVGVGDVLTLRGFDGPLRLTVLGAVEDYSAPKGLLLVHRGHFERAMNLDTVDIVDIYLPPGTPAAEIEAARAALAKSSLAAEHALVPLTGAEVKHHILEVIRRIYSIAYLQEVVVGAVAALGVAAALMISVLQRRREIGLLRAVGATQGQILRTVVYEALFMGLIGAVLGVLFGVLLEWYAVRVILAEESGFHFPVVVPWFDSVLIALLAALTATAAGLLPALRAVRLRIADAIAYE